MTSNGAFLIGIIGSGPIGLECGLQALKHGYPFIIFESGSDIASNVRSWSHVRLFTPLYMNVSPLGKPYLLMNTDESAYLNGNDYIECYLRPISYRMQSNIRLRHRVVSIARRRANEFIILTENDQNGREEYVLVNCVIDASGVYGCPNFAGLNNLPAINERALRTLVPSPLSYRIPSGRDKYLAGKRILLIGKGLSAATTAVFLAQLKKHHPETQLFWVIKQKIDHLPYRSNPEDLLEQGRGLVDEANRVYADGFTFSEIFTNTVVTQFVLASSSNTVHITLDTYPPRLLRHINHVIVNTGSHPDRSVYSNLAVKECHLTKGPMALAAKLYPSRNDDCMKQTSHGASSMLTTEPNFFIVGIKSYGKLSNFRMKIGFEQVDQVFQLIQTSRSSITGNNSCIKC